ncbi:carbon-nitrogen hydrolase [Violaceomyces palustris]|uniref:Carbon-nitrogen hydrolase n=1 Tax=Violaceomyces palustris TaxID=1673888 RepID=A0ACD0NQJ1_9BASI|nr:carbon-nitrogen hydrolase [Violaceomyces palustris]
MAYQTVEEPILLALVQDSPVSFNLEASIQKLKVLTRDAAEKASKQAESTYGKEMAENAPIVVVFPEAFLCAYPRGYDFGAKIGSRTPEGRAWFQRYHASSVPVCDVEGPEMTAIRSAASENGVTLVVGVIERCDKPESGPRRGAYGSENAGGPGTLYCTCLTISPQGELLSSHRKLMPTGSERLVWGQGDGAGIRVVDTPAGKVGSVICWENYMPLHRMAVYAKGVEVYCAPTADTRDTWTSSMRHIGAEGRCFVISCCQFNVRSDFPDDYPGYPGLAGDEIVTRGGSMIVGPLGEILAGPLFDQRGILTATVKRSSLIEAKMDFDPSGHYARPDVLRLVVDGESKEAARCV